MDATNQRFAYRCLPLTIANQHGWELLCPCAFEAEWNGEVGPHAIRVEPLGGAEGLLPGSHFGEGVLTFHTEYLFRTLLVKDSSGINTRRLLKSNTSGDIGIDQTGTNINGR